MAKEKYLSPQRLGLILASSDSVVLTQKQKRDIVRSEIGFLFASTSVFFLANSVIAYIILKETDYKGDVTSGLLRATLYGTIVGLSFFSPLFSLAVAYFRFTHVRELEGLAIPIRTTPWRSAVRRFFLGDTVYSLLKRRGKF